jgi:hypothetical protein
LESAKYKKEIYNAAKASFIFLFYIFIFVDRKRSKSSDSIHGRQTLSLNTGWQTFLKDQGLSA